MLGIPAVLSSRPCSSLSEEEADSLKFSEMVLKFAEKVKMIVGVAPHYWCILK